MSNEFLKRPKFSLLALLMIVVVLTTHAQQNTVVRSNVSVNSSSSNSVTVTGVVVDAKDKMPIVGASIWIKNTTTGVVTDLDGKFKINVDRTSNVLQISYIGYKSVEVLINGKTNFNIELSEESERLQEVVVSGSATQQRQSITGAISNVEPARLKVAGAPKVSTLLAGQVAGVVSLTRSGEPGAGSEFYIRGIASFAGSNNPLVLVDGVERDMNLIDTEDIASFSVLKDASAAALYGMRGANGVIIITTNRGQAGKPKVRANAEFGLSQPTFVPKLANSAQWAEMYNEASGTNYYSEAAIQKYASGEDTDLYPNENWFNRLYKPFSDNKRIGVNISGGNDFTRYYISGAYYNESSIFKQADDIYGYQSSPEFNRFNFRANVDVNLSKSTVVNLDLSNIYEKTFGPGTTVNDIWTSVFLTSPNVMPYQYSDGTISGPPTATGGGANPWNQLVHSGYRENFWNNAQARVGLTQELDFITKGLKFSFQFSFDNRNNTSITRSKTPTHFYANSRDVNGNLIFGPAVVQGNESLGYSRTVSGNMTNSLESVLSYRKRFAEKHDLNAMFMYSHNQKLNTNADNQVSSIPNKYQGLAARFAYGFDNKYFIETNLGYNGSENFAPGYRFGFFPSISAGWVVSQEEFMRPLENTLSYLKLRGSYGMLGNDGIQGRRFIYMATIVEGREFWFGDTRGVGGKSLREGDPENLAVSWETAHKYNFGVELELFRKLKLNLDVFQENRDGIFIQRESLPALVGLTNRPFTNVGKALSRGFDGTLEYTQKVGQLMLTSRVVYSFSRNKILDNDQPDYMYKYQNRIGKPISQRFGLVALGVFESEEEIAASPEQKFGPYRVGDIKYKDVNGDGFVDDFDQVAIGKTTVPEITYGIGGTASWKGIELNLLFSGVGNTNFHLGGSSIYAFNQDNMQRSAFNEDLYYKSWKTTNTVEQNANAIYPRMSIGGQAGSNNNQKTSTYWLRDGSFMRLDNLELAYNLPTKLTKKVFLSSARVFFTGRNLVTFSPFKLWDPVRANGDGSGYPPNRSYLFGIQTSF